MKLAATDTGFDNIIDVADDLYKSVNYLEIVPTKHKSYKDLSVNDLINYKKSINDIGLSPYSLLSLFYTLDIPNVSYVEEIINHLYKLNNYMVALDCNLMVFGSPNMRKKIPGWENFITEILFYLDKVLNMSNKYFIIEPVAPQYGAEFFTTIDEIVSFLDKNSFTNIFTMIDTHNLFLIEQDPIQQYKNYKDYIKHIHIAEVGLGELKNKDFHTRFANTLSNYEYVLTHEIRDRNNFVSSIKTFKEIYS